MDAALNRKSLTFGIPGIILQLAGNVMANMGTSNPQNPNWAMALGGLAVALVGTALLIYGLALYAQAKGQSGWWGLMGLLSCIGLLVLALLPDKTKGA